MVWFFTRGQKVHPIRDSPGYKESKADRKSSRRGGSRSSGRQTTLPKLTKAQRQQLQQEERRYKQDQKAAAKAAKEKARRDAQAKRAQDMWERWERREDERKARAALRELKKRERERDQMEDEERRELRRLEQDRKRTIYSFLKGGVRPGARDVQTEYRLYMPPQFKRRSGMPADEVAALMHSSAPWLGVRNEDDLYTALRKLQSA